MSAITWLHISDLHWREKQTYDAQVVAHALLADLARREEIASDGKLTHIDFILFTGDLAFASHPAEYKLARQFLDDLLRITRVRKNRLFIVPGNHDVDRKAVSPEARSAIRCLKDQQSIDGLFSARSKRMAVMQRFHAYRRFFNNYLGPYLVFDDKHYFYVKNCTVANKRVSILGLNTAWASASNADRLKLLLGEPQVRAALKQTQSADIRIALMHHPFEWLADFDRSSCMPILLRECDFVLFGHLHDPDLLHLKSPGVDAMLNGAGACYETRKHPNAYNLVHLDLVSGIGTVYLRAYSNREGGFWAPDTLRYPKIPGQYIFQLPEKLLERKSVETLENVAALAESRPKENFAPFAAVSSYVPMKEPNLKTGIDKWWNERGYYSNPFDWANAAEIPEKDWAGRVENLPMLLAAWHVDPCISIANPLNKQTMLSGLGNPLMLEEIISPKTGEPVLIYAPAGSGKTFYRRWAVYEVKETYHSHAVEIDRIDWLNWERSTMTPGAALTRQIYEQACGKLGIIGTRSLKKDVYHIWSQFEKTLANLWPAQESNRRFYVFVDAMEQLFGADESVQNSKALEAIVELVKAADRQAGVSQLALRIFLPVQLQHLAKSRLGNLRRVHSREIEWKPEHCMMIIERRLRSYWEGDPNLVHLNRLFTLDAMDEFRRWLQRQEAISPRCIITVINDLASYAWRKRILTDPIKVEVWNDFIAAEKPENSCRKDFEYPLSVLLQRGAPAVRQDSLVTPKENDDSGAGFYSADVGQGFNTTEEEVQLKRRRKLHKILEEHFSMEELRTLCFDLGIDHESLTGEDKPAKARELILFLERHNLVNEIIRTGREIRPDIDWGVVSGAN